MDPTSAEIVASAMAGASICWALAYAWAKWLARPGATSTPAASEDRLLRLEQAIDAVAIEVERIGEGQCYTARLLAERLPAERVPAHLPLGRVHAE